MPTDTVLNTIPRPTIAPSPEVLSMTRRNRCTCYKMPFRHTDAFIGCTYWTHFKCQPRRTRRRRTRRILDVPEICATYVTGIMINSYFRIFNLHFTVSKMAWQNSCGATWGHRPHNFLAVGVIATMESAPMIQGVAPSSFSSPSTAKTFRNFVHLARVEYTYGTPMSVLPSFAERKRVWVFRRCTLSLGPPVKKVGHPWLGEFFSADAGNNLFRDWCIRPGHM